MNYLPLPEPRGKIGYPEGPWEEEWVSSSDAFDGDQMHAYVDADRAAQQERKPELQEAIVHYEAALAEAFPKGACGKAFEHWNAARIIIKDHK